MSTTPPGSLFVTNASCVGADKRRVREGRAAHRAGPGRMLTIMCAPRRWERGDGLVELLAPWLQDLRQLQDEAIDIREYRVRYVRKVLRPPGIDALAPGRLVWTPTGGGAPGLVEPGDTLVCACSVLDAEQGRCHRVWAAGLLLQAGWPSIILDGRPTFGVDDFGCPVRVRPIPEDAR